MEGKHCLRSTCVKIARMTPEEAKALDEARELKQLMDVEFYAASVNAWYSTSLEHDKSIFALSAGGIGLLITLLTTIGVSSSLLLHLYITAIFCLLVSLCTMLVIFRRNRTHVEQVLSGQAVRDSVLAWLDLLAILMFGAGVVLTAIIGISAAVNSYETKGKAMANEKQGQTSTQTIANESFNGMTNLQKSFNGVANIQPQAVVSAQIPAPASSPSPSTPVVQTTASGMSQGGSGKYSNRHDGQKS